MVQEVVIKPVETAASQEIQVKLSMDNNSMLLSPITLLDVQEASKLIEDEDISSMEVFKLPRDTTYGMEDDVPDLVYKKVAIKPAPSHVQGSPNPGVGGGPQRDQLPEDLHPPQDGVGSPLSPEVKTSKVQLHHVQTVKTSFFSTHSYRVIIWN